MLRISVEAITPLLIGWRQVALVFHQYRSLAFDLVTSQEQFAFER